MTTETRPSGAARIGPARKITYPLLVETISRYREEALSREPPDPQALDRRRVLRRLAAELGTDGEELALRGFDRAYRLIIEGV